MEGAEPVGVGEQVAEPGRQVDELGRVVGVEHVGGSPVDAVGRVADDARGLVVLAGLRHADEVPAPGRPLQQHRGAIALEDAGGAVPVERGEQVGAALLLPGVGELEHRRLAELREHGHERARRGRPLVAVGAQAPPSQPGGLPGVAGIHGTEVAHGRVHSLPAHGS